MKKIVFICPYFGHIPRDQMNIWLKTCEYNPKVNWIVLSDDKGYFCLPKNVKMIYMTLNEMRNEIQKHFKFKISLESAYKLCDFKPAYGYIFQNLIKEYDYWGHCDLSDSIFGNFENVLSNVLNEENEKIGFLGHMTLYKNTKEINERIFLESGTDFKLSDILGTKKNMAFDETTEYSINAIYMNNNFKIKRIDSLYADISTKSYSFRTSMWNEQLKWSHIEQDKYIFEWQNGKLYKICFSNGKIYRKEILYVHYQKRKIKYKINIKEINHFILVPNEFKEYEEINQEMIRKYTVDKINFNKIKIKYDRIRKRIRGES